MRARRPIRPTSRASVQAPIFHVNGDDPEAVVHVARLAAEFRQRFKKDVVIDLWCYRRHGHNEGDEPSFTQPLMYRTIAQHPTTRQIYARRLIDEGVVSDEEAQASYDAFQERMSAAHEAAAGYKMNKADWLEGAWSGLTRAPEQYERGSTAVPLELLREVGLAMTAVPESVHLHRKLERIIGERRAERSRAAPRSTGRPPSIWPSARCCARASRCA